MDRREEIKGKDESVEQKENKKEETVKRREKETRPTKTSTSSLPPSPNRSDSAGNILPNARGSIGPNSNHSSSTVTADTYASRVIQSSSSIANVTPIVPQSRRLQIHEAVSTSVGVVHSLSSLILFNLV
jgi:hypothetical protein